MAIKSRDDYSINTQTKADKTDKAEAEVSPLAYNITVSLTLSVGQVETIDNVARKMGMTRSSLLRELVILGMETMLEDQGGGQNE